MSHRWEKNCKVIIKLVINCFFNILKYKKKVAQVNVTSSEGKCVSWRDWGIVPPLITGILYFSSNAARMLFVLMIAMCLGATYIPTYNINVQWFEFLITYTSCRRGGLDNLDMFSEYQNTDFRIIYWRQFQREDVLLTLPVKAGESNSRKYTSKVN